LCGDGVASGSDVSVGATPVVIDVEGAAKLSLGASLLQ
jgi:hypothetical protein